jgi:hypothetical protein
MLPGETIFSGASGICCGVKLEIQVLHSGGGWYLGTHCPQCGPYSRETEYYATEEMAKKMLDQYKKGWTYMMRT